MRLPDWHERLNALVRARIDQPFEWGVNDCCLWPADAVLAMTGRDPAASLRGTYASARGAKSALQQVGGLAGAGARCGVEIPPLFAQIGDVGLVNNTGERDAGAVCIGEQWLAVGRKKMGLVELSAARRAWRVA